MMNNNQIFFSRIHKTFPKRRNKIIEWLNQDRLTKRRLRVIFHAAGHATAIYLNNKAGNFPPVFFQLGFHALPSQSTNDDKVYRRVAQSTPGGDRLVAAQYLPANASIIQITPETGMDSSVEADIINLLIGPLAEARHIAETDNELFNQCLINVQALKNYGGGPKLELINDYLQSVLSCQQQQEEKLASLFAVAFNFITNEANWLAITKLANYIFDNEKNSICHEDMVSLLEH